jgi:hypothetical protein
MPHAATGTAGRRIRGKVGLEKEAGDPEVGKSPKFVFGHPLCLVALVRGSIMFNLVVWML